MTPIRFQTYCTNQHDVVCNQKYQDNLPYSFHLECVAQQAKKFLHILSDNNARQDVIYAAWGHDLIEDARVTYNDLLQLFNGRPNVPNIIYALTDLRGKSRAERHGDEYFKLLQESVLATYVKLADLAANKLFSKLTGSSMYDKYCKEFPRFKKMTSVHYDALKPFFDYVESI